VTDPHQRALRQVLAGRAGDLPGATVIHATRIVIAAAVLLSHLVGALIVLLLLGLAFPVPDEVTGAVAWRNVAIGAGYVVVVFPLGLWAGLRAAGDMDGWLIEDRPPTAAERRRTLQLPLRLQAQQGALWAVAAVIGVLGNLATSTRFAVEVGITVALGGISTVAIAFLLTQRLARPVRARLLEADPPRREEIAGVALQALLSWFVGTAVPVIGAVAIAIGALMVDMSAHGLARAVIVLGGTALLVGFGAMVLFARSISQPLRELRDALDRLEAGDFDVHLTVSDSSEIGYVQAGFNRTAAGLRERERLRDLFGRHVGQDVARRAVEEGVQLGGEERFAAALFVDIIGSTALAVQRGPTEVVDALNAFFGIVVDVVVEGDGFVNKFEGDGALCVFGAPLEHPDAATAALAAARRLQVRLTEELPDLPAASGVSAGTVVAGNVGAADRFEYTVIGDPVNEATRLTERAKDLPGRVCASEAALARASTAEAARWELGDAVTLRGRDEPTRVASPLR
jgi:adenylate cyclase